ncbi:YiiD C-terminal domain-containing protein [Thalassotalea maritima]|uniref:bifunctional GNAT family N-acetyltransferase/hotdog fold thioesterase n=1 Tax=Thalassotalea maritima TaxID=3242416 RepID=UPI00352971FE
MAFTLVTPQSEADFKVYHQLRYKVLRQPWGQKPGSEVDDIEQQAVHRMLTTSDGNVAAVGRLHKTASDVAQIRFMAVDDKYQGQGIGKQLLDALEQEAHRQGVRRIDLNAREVAVPFYRACGYQLHDKSHCLYNEIQHYKMSKSLKKFHNDFSDQLDALEQIWHQTIPVSAFMNIQPVSLVADQLTVCASREANVNLHNTMFAGSIYTLATLTGWGRAYLLLTAAGLQGDIVLADANMRYHKPLQGQPLAQTVAVQGDVAALDLGRRARLSIDVKVKDGDLTVASFTGKYVILPKDS